MELLIAACGESKSIVVRFFGAKLFSMVGNKFIVVPNCEEVSIDPANLFIFRKKKKNKISYNINRKKNYLYHKRTLNNSNNSLIHE